MDFLKKKKLLCKLQCPLVRNRSRDQNLMKKPWQKYDQKEFERGVHWMSSIEGQGAQLGTLLKRA